MKTITDYSAIINKAIAAIDYPQLPSLYEPIAYTMEGAGKRLRPVLTLAAADALHSDVNNAVKPALGIELYHNFTLLHDDIMDNSPTRRGRQAVWKKWDTAQAILSGDTMFSIAVDCMLGGDYSAEQRLDMMKCFNSTAIAVDHGQQYDMDFERRDDVTLDEYIEMISLKTGALLAGACEIGAICGGASEHVRKSVSDYGINLGIAFQIQDDILDVYADEATLGKPIGGDIANDKHTWLHITAIAEAPEAMAEIYARKLQGREKYEAVRGIYDSLSLRQKAEKEVERYLNLAVASIEKSGLEKSAVDFFTAFAQSLIGRKK